MRNFIILAVCALTLGAQAGLTKPRAPPSYGSSDSDIETRSLDQIYALARQEAGELQVSWGGDEPLQNAMVVSAFTAAYPDVKINITVDLSKYHDSRADRSYATTKSDGVDIAILQTTHDFPRWAKQGRLLPYKVASWNTIDPKFRDTNGQWASAWIWSFGQRIYNPAKLSTSELPATPQDLVKPSFAGKIALTYPNDDDAIAYLFVVLIKKHGWAWFEALAASGNVRWVRGSATGATLLADAADPAAFSFTSHPNMKTVMPAETPVDETMSWPQTAAIFKSTKMPESAKLFMAFLFGDAYQAHMVKNGFTVTRRDMQGSPDPWAEGRNPLGFVEWMGDRQQVEWWKLQFETTLGTAQGKTPLRDEL